MQATDPSTIVMFVAHVTHTCTARRHLLMGMGFAVQIGEASDIPAAPAGTRYCGTVPSLMGPPVRNAFVSGGCAA